MAKFDLAEILPDLVLGAMRLVEALVGPGSGRKKKRLALAATREALTAVLREVDLPYVDGEQEIAIEDAVVEALIDGLHKVHFSKPAPDA